MCELKEEPTTSHRDCDDAPRDSSHYSSLGCAGTAESILCGVNMALIKSTPDEDDL
jgi:hypothetical protein